MKLTKVNIKSRENHTTKTGGTHFNVFTNNADGTQFIERTTLERHNLMKGENGSKHNPVKIGYTWVYTMGTLEYDTPNGELEEGQYAEDGDIYQCRFAGTERLEIYQIDKTKIVDGEVKKEDIDSINKEFNKEISWR